MKYVLLFCGDDEDAAAFAAMTPVELRARYEQVGAWFAEHHRVRVPGLEGVDAELTGWLRRAYGQAG